MKLIVLCLILTGCAYTPELTVFAGPRQVRIPHPTGNPSIELEDLSLTVLLIQKYGKKGHGVVGCVHSSAPDRGRPFNDRDDIQLDSCGLGARWGGK